MRNARRFAVSAGLILTIIGGWTYYKVSAPWYYTSNGSSEWAQEMRVDARASFLPAYRTQIGMVDRTGGVKENGKVTRKNDWATFRIWNGYGVKKLSVSAKRSGKKIFDDAPGHVSIEDIFYSPYPLEAFDQSVLFSQSDTYGHRHYIVTVPMPAGEDSLVVTVTDKFGNVTSATLRIPPDTWHDNPPVARESRPAPRAVSSIEAGDRA